jgi:hypothetical protein
MTLLHLRLRLFLLVVCSLSVAMSCFLPRRSQSWKLPWHLKQQQQQHRHQWVQEAAQQEQQQQQHLQEWMWMRRLEA